MKTLITEFGNFSDRFNENCAEKDTMDTTDLLIVSRVNLLVQHDSFTMAIGMF